MSNIAVLIPTYKPGRYIHRCLESLDNQTLAKDKFKVYIALNGPKEGFKSFIQSIIENMSFDYEFFYIEKAGVSNARNYLIENSTEQYITFIDDDDSVSPTYLESLLYAANTDIIGISIVYNFEHDIEERKPSYIGQSFIKLPAIEKSKFKSRKYYSSPCAKLIHRNIIGKTRFNSNLSIGEDSLFMAELSNKVASVRKASIHACYYVYERQGSTTRRPLNKSDELKRILYLLKKFSRLLFLPGYSTPFILSRIVATLLHSRNLL